MTDYLGLKVEDARSALARAGEGAYAVEMLAAPKGAREGGTPRVVAVRAADRVLLAARFIDMYAKTETDG
jgi:hypothetical protein